MHALYFRIAEGNREPLEITAITKLMLQKGSYGGSNLSPKPHSALIASADSHQQASTCGLRAGSRVAQGHGAVGAMPCFSWAQLDQHLAVFGPSGCGAAGWPWAGGAGQAGTPASSTIMGGPGLARPSTRHREGVHL